LWDFIIGDDILSQHARPPTKFWNENLVKEGVYDPLVQEIKRVCLSNNQLFPSDNEFLANSRFIKQWIAKFKDWELKLHSEFSKDKLSQPLVSSTPQIGHSILPDCCYPSQVLIEIDFDQDISII